MNEHLLAIGMFVFGIPRLAYNELERRASWRWGKNERYGARAAAQFLGPGEEKLTLNGVLVPEIAGSFSDIERLREMAASGEAWPLILGNGEELGDFVILNVDERWRHIIAGGRPRVLDFAVDLERVERERPVP
jgi:hypothetical protein